MRKKLPMKGTKLNPLQDWFFQNNLKQLNSFRVIGIKPM